MQKIARSPLRISKYLIPMAMITYPRAMMGSLDIIVGNGINLNLC